jgi:general secretion pathway protein A
MYRQFFGLQQAPFNVSPSPRYLYLTKELHEVLAALLYGVNNRKGFVTLIGEVGTGKTTILNRFLELLNNPKIKTAFIHNSRINSSHLLEFILTKFQIPCDSESKVQKLVTLNQWLLDRYEAGESVVLIIDEAQNLSYPVLEEIRLLTNLETPEDKLLQVILSGQPELDDKLNQPQLRQLRQRVGVQCRTLPLTLEQTHEYVVARLRVAGASGEPIFTPQAINRIYEFSCGIPRLINLVCEHSLVHGYVEGQRPIEPPIIEKIAHEFRLREAAPVPRPERVEVNLEFYNCASFVQDFGAALSQFRSKPLTRERN